MDEGWQPRSQQGDGTRYYGEYDWIDDVVEYANEKGVGLIAWVHVDDLNTPEKRAQRLDRWAELGIKGIKVDFFDRETDERVQLMEDVYADCERLHLVANVHGANKPTGEVRTHPGILTREDIYGQELGDLSPVQYTILPFTRNAVGPADEMCIRDSLKRCIYADNRIFCIKIIVNLIVPLKWNLQTRDKSSLIEHLPCNN